MKLVSDFILSAPEHLRPTFRISPFKTSDIERNSYYCSNYESDGTLRQYFKNKYPDKEVYITRNGRSAICLALKALKLDKSDVVTIITTTNNFYISSCVTNEIEKVCSWSREIEEKTKVLLINHEFGFCCQNLRFYKSLGYPIIEDFAHSFYSDSKSFDAGLYGDFLIYSLSKYFPVQAGGALLYTKNYEKEFGLELISDDISKHCGRVVSAYIGQVDKIAEKRISNYRYYEELFKKINLNSYFKIKDNDCPGVFCFSLPDSVDLKKMKVYMNQQGIESSVFYGVNAYFLPCHQALSEKELEYIYIAVRSYLNGLI